MAKIEYTEHFLNRASIRNISKSEVIKTLNQPNLCVSDALNSTRVALKKIGKEKYLGVVYIENDGKITVITAHYLRASQVKNRIEKGRWRL